MKDTQTLIDNYLAPDSTDWKKRAQTWGWVIYYACVLTASAHQLNWTFNTLTGFFAIMGIVGGLGLAGNAVLLPRAIKEWTVESAHRLTAIAMYVIDFVLMVGFVWVDTNLMRGINTQAVQDYAYWIAPITFMVPVATWGLLFILDPDARQKYEILKLQQKSEKIRIKADMARQVIEAESYADKVLTTATRTAQLEAPKYDEDMLFNRPWPQPETQPEQPEMDMIYSGYDLHEHGPGEYADFPPPEYLDDLPDAPPTVTRISGNNHHPKA